MKNKLTHLFRNFYQFFAGKTASGQVPFPRKKEWEEALKHL